VQTLFISGLATGRIKAFGTITACLNICQVVVAYIALRLGANPIATVAVIGAWEVFAYSIQLYTLGRLIDFRYSDYFQQVQIRSILIVAAAGGISYIASLHIPQNFIGLILVCCITTLLSLTLSYILLLNQQERLFVREKANAIIHKFRK